MSETMGQVYLAREKRARFMDTGLEPVGEYSEATSEMIDREIREIISRQYEAALNILRGKKDALEKGARLLLEKETIEGEEIKKFFQAD